MGSVGKGGAGSQSSQQQQKQLSPLESFRQADGSGVDDVMQAIRNMNTTNFDGDPNNYTQRLINHLDLHGAGTVLDDKTYDKSVKDNALGGVSLFRGVRGNWNTGLSAQDVIKQTMFDNKNIVGSGIHGNGIYFTTNLNYAKRYGGDNIMQAYIDKSKAVSITEGDLRTMAQTDPVAKKFGLDGSGRGQTDKLAQYALHKGYNVIHVPGGNMGGHYAKSGDRGTFRIDSNGNKSGEDYYVPLTKKVLVFRENARKRRGKYL